MCFVIIVYYHFLCYVIWNIWKFKSSKGVSTHSELHRCSNVPPSSVTVDWDILEDR